MRPIRDMAKEDFPHWKDSGKHHNEVTEDGGSFREKTASKGQREEPEHPEREESGYAGKAKKPNAAKEHKEHEGMKR